MAPKSKSRILPKDKNLVIESPEERSSLVRRCRHQKVVFDDFTVNVIRLKVPTPIAAGSEQIGSQRFLSRMKDTNFFQVISMFDVAFPFATEKEREAEIAHLEKHYPIVRDAKVKGLWLTGDNALTLAKDYGLEEYILAMQEASPNKPSDSLTEGHIKQEATSPETPNVEPAEPRRSRRSASPKKKPAKPATTTKGRKKKGSTADDESVRSASPVPHGVAVKAEEALDKIKEEGKPILDTIKVGKNDAAELLEAARAQVEAAAAEEQTAPPSTRVKRALDIAEDSSAEETTVKRARVDDLERQVWAEGRRGRALLGLAVGLGVSVVLPYLV